MATQFDISKLVRSNVAALKPYSSARDEFTDFKSDMVFLDANENPFNTGVNRYPDPRQVTLKAQISKVKRIPIDQILLGNGSDEVLDLIFRAFCNPGKDNVIIAPPTYGMYKVLAGTNDIACREVLLTPGFQLDTPAILGAVDENTKLLFICSPNNPTGNTMAAEAIAQLLECFNGLVVLDEAYIDFSERNSWLGELQNHPNLIVCQTLSKAYGLAGIRLGMCFASAEIITVLNKIKPPYNVNELTQRRALERVLKLDIVKSEITDIQEEKERLSEVLVEISFIETVFESDANFLLARASDADMVYDKLIQKGIVVRNRSNQPLCKNTLRFTVGTRQENKKLIEALRAISNTNKSK